MSETTPERQILTPGAAPAAAAAAATAPASAPEAPARRKPGPKSAAEKAAAAAADSAQTGTQGDDDLDGYSSEDAGDAAFTPKQMVEVQRLITTAVAASRSSQDPGTALKLAAESQKRLPTQAAAQAMQADAVARGHRPRAILSDEGWVVHPEMTRRPDSLNGQAIAALPAATSK